MSEEAKKILKEIDDFWVKFDARNKGKRKATPKELRKLKWIKFQISIMERFLGKPVEKRYKDESGKLVVVDLICRDDG